MEVLEIKKFAITEYVSIEKQMLLDAQKYVERAEMYLAIGKIKHCTGCLVKASKKMEKAEAMKISLDGLSQALMQPMLKLMNDRIADAIMKA